MSKHKRSSTRPSSPKRSWRRIVAVLSGVLVLGLLLLLLLGRHRIRWAWTEHRCLRGEVDACLDRKALSDVGEEQSQALEQHGRVILAERCKNGDGPACVRLAERAGQEPGPDPGLAQEAALRACELGAAASCYQGAVALEQEPDRRVELMTKGCRAGEVKACRWIAETSWSGPGPVTDPSLLEVACTAGVGKACVFLAGGCRTGAGVPLDWRRARELLASAAPALERECDAGFGGPIEDPCTMLGDLYQTGRGVPRNLGRAVQLWKKACAREAGGDGCRRVGVRLRSFFGRGCHHVNGMSTAPISEDAAACDKLTQAAGTRPDELGRAADCYRSLAERCEGDGVDGRACRPVEDPECSKLYYGKALELFDQACTGGVPAACSRHGRMLQVGLGAAQNLEAAEAAYAREASLLGEACGRGDPDACGQWSALLWTGKGVSEDWQRATDVAQRALELYHGRCGTVRTPCKETLSAPVPPGPPALLGAAIAFRTCCRDTKGTETTGACCDAFGNRSATPAGP